MNKTRSTYLSSGLAAALLAAGAVTIPLVATSTAEAAAPCAATDTATATGATATASVTAQGVGGTVKITGSGWTTTDSSSGSVAAIKLDDGAYSRLDTTVNANKTIWAVVSASDSGVIDASVTLPDGTTSGSNGSSPAFTPGEHCLRLLTGSLKSGDKIRSVALPFTVAATSAPTTAATTPAPATVPTTAAPVPVVKVAPTIMVKPTKSKTKRGRTASFKVTVKAAGVTPTGVVTLKVAGRTVKAKLKNGLATVKVKIARSTKPGAKAVTVSYAGDDAVLAAVAAKKKITVTK